MRRDSQVSIVLKKDPFCYPILPCPSIPASIAITIGCAKVPLIRSWDSKAGVAGVGITPEPEGWEVVTEGGRVWVGI
jgi:hypothetical protein